MRGYDLPGEITETRGIGDIDSAVAVQVISINEVGAGSVTLYTPPANRIFLCYHVLIDNHSGALLLVIVKSAATEIARVKALTATGRELRNSGFPVFVGRAAGEALVLTVDQACTGFVVVGYRK